MNQLFAVAATSAPWQSLSSVSGLWNSLTAIQWAAAVSAVVLTLGAVLEYRHQLKLLALLSSKWLLRKATPFEVCALKKLLLHTLGPILVVVGIAGDFVFGARTFILENRQELGAEQTIASLKNATSANERETAQLRHDNLDLLALIQPRELTDDQQKAIGDVLKLFSGKFVLIRTYSYDQEAMRLAELITASLKFGKVEVQFSPTAFPGLLNLPIGIWVTGTNKSFVTSLKNALNIEGKLALTDPKWKAQMSAGTFVGSIMPKPPDAEIFVGAKPFSALAVIQELGTVEQAIVDQGPRAKLIAKAAPRLAKELALFAGQRVEVFVCGQQGTADQETLDTWGAIANILDADTVSGVTGAKWKLVPTNLNFAEGCGAAKGLGQGIVVFVSKRASKSTMEAANVLGHGLAKALPPSLNKMPTLLDPDFVKLTADRGFQDKNAPWVSPGLDPDLITVLIGEHP